MVLRLMTLAVGVLCVCALAIPGAASAQSSTAVPPGFVGVNVDGPLFPVTAPGVDLSSQMDTMVAAGVETVRVVFDWSYAQPYKTWAQVPADETSQFVNTGGIPTRWADLDALMSVAAAHGLTVMPTVLYTPSWDATPHPFKYSNPKQVGPYANFLTDLVKRYGPHGTFWQTNSPAVPIRSWQIWNEPNINVYWSKQPFQKAYAQLLAASHNAIKRVDPGAKIVLAGLPNESWTQLAKLYQVPGVKKLFDVVALHPYTKDPQGVITILAKARQVMDLAGDASKPIIADEISWPSSQGQTPHNTGFDFATTQAGQASKIAQVLPLLVKNRAALNLSGFFYYTWAGLDDHNGLAFDFAGLFHFNNSDATFTAKPAFGAFRKAALAMEHCRTKGTIATVCATPS
jgi:arabinogalactan endo-1,4-beta-galactosidase